MIHITSSYGDGCGNSSPLDAASLGAGVVQGGVRVGLNAGLDFLNLALA